MSDSDDLRDSARAIRGRVSTSEAWMPVRDLNNSGADLLSSGNVEEGARMLREAIALTEGSDAPDARDLRSRALLNLSSAHDYKAELSVALQLVDEAIFVGADLIEEIGDVRGTRTVVVNGMISRTQILAQADRLDEALVQVDEAAAVLERHTDVLQAELMQFQVHNIRSSILLVLGRLQEAESEARLALDLALRIDPGMAANPYVNLGAIAQQTGDQQAANEFIELANAIQEQSGDLVTRQLALENRARTAMQQERFEEAGEAFREAAALAKQSGLVTRATACRMGGAAVYLQTGNPVLAAQVMRELIADLGTEGAVHDRREAYGFLGDAESKRGKFERAQEAYDMARTLTRSAHERCRVDLRRAEMQAEWASFTVRPGKRLDRLRAGLELAIPVLLATEALRGDFPPGPIRERWSLQVAAPARELAFRLAVTLHDADLLLELIENAAASATLQAEALEVEALEREEMPAPGGPALAPVVDLFTSADADADVNAATVELPAAASGFAGAMATSTPVRFAPPPRVVGIPGAEPALEKWIRIAETEYGVTVRSDSVVAAW